MELDIMLHSAPCSHRPLVWVPLHSYTISSVQFELI
jgi:hypothetical protein